MGNINITGGELDSQGDMVFGGKHVHLPPQAPEWHPPKQMLNVLPTFVGRQGALQDLATLGAIGVTTPRFLIAGVGGLGKTSLAAQITHEIKSRFTGGILLAEIPTVDVFLKLGEWAGLYGGDIKELQDVNQRADRVRDIIQQRVGAKRVLAVLDGVVDESDDAKLAPLLRALRDCAVIVTSRARQLAAIPDAWLIQLEQLNDEETWQLFVRVMGNDKRLENQRALVLEIGKLVDCLPMALDLAAHQLADNSSWSVAYLRGLLQDEIRQLEILHWGGDESERGIRASIRISYNRLSAAEQTFLDALGAFAGIDFDAHAAAAVCETDFETARKRLAKLRRISVIQDGTAPERYKLHALMRTFTRENLRAVKTDSAVQLRMAKYYCDIARENGKKLKGKEIDNALAILDAEIANISAGQKWARENATREARELTRSFAYALAIYFDIRAMWQEKVEWSREGIFASEKLDDLRGISAMHQMIGLAEEARGNWDEAIREDLIAIEGYKKIQDERGLAQTFNNLGNVYLRKGEWDTAIEFYQKDLAISERVGDVHGMAQTFNNLGLVYADKGEWDKAIEFYQQSLVTKERVGDVHGMAQTFNNLGIVYRQKGEWDKAIEFYQQSLVTKERVGDVHGMAQTFNNLGLVYADKGEWDKAIEFYQKDLAISERVGDVQGMAKTYTNLGLVYADKGEWDKAIALYQQSLEIKERLGDVQGMAKTFNNLGIVYRQKGEWDKAIEFYQQALQTMERVGDVVGVSSTAWNLGLVLKEQGKLADAIQWMEKCVVIEERLGHPDAEKDRAEVEELKRKLEQE